MEKAALEKLHKCLVMILQPEPGVQESAVNGFRNILISEGVDVHALSFTNGESAGIADFKSEFDKRAAEYRAAMDGAYPDAVRLREALVRAESELSLLREKSRRRGITDGRLADMEAELAQFKRENRRLHQDLLDMRMEERRAERAERIEMAQLRKARRDDNSRLIELLKRSVTMMAGETDKADMDEAEFVERVAELYPDETAQAFFESLGLPDGPLFARNLWLRVMMRYLGPKRHRRRRKAGADGHPVKPADPSPSDEMPNNETSE